MEGESQTQRLLKYRMALKRLQRMGLEKAFSHTIGNETNVSAELVRKDFSNYGIKGNRRGGYEIEELLASLEKIFGKSRVQNIIVVGMGNLGRALFYYKGFERHKLNIVAGFDIDPAKQSKKEHAPIYAPDKMQEVIEAFDVSLAVVSVPEISAQEVTNELVSYGIKAILNFAPALLKVPGNVMVNNVNLMVEIERLMFHAGVLK